MEPRGKMEFHTAIESYYDKIQDQTANGALFAAVCRGKVSVVKAGLLERLVSGLLADMMQYCGGRISHVNTCTRTVTKAKFWYD